MGFSALVSAPALTQNLLMLDIDLGPRSRLEPSEVVVLAAERFAPLPPFPGSRRERWSAEWDFASWPAGVAAFALFLALVIDDQQDGAVIRWGGCLVALACAAYWWFTRQRLGGRVHLSDVDIVKPLGTATEACRDELLVQTLVQALLALEASGDLTLSLEDGQAHAVPQTSADDNARRWPAYGLERALLRGQALPVAVVVFDWLSDGSHFPWKRGWRLVEHTMARRGLAQAPKAGDAPRLRDPALLAQARADSAALLARAAQCQRERPALWQALQSAIHAGLEARTVEPRREGLPNGGARLVYDYREAPLEALDAQAAGATAAAASAAAGPVPATRIASRWSLLLLAAGFALLAASGLHFEWGQHWLGGAQAGLLLAVYGCGVAEAQWRLRRWRHARLDVEDERWKAVLQKTSEDHARTHQRTFPVLLGALAAAVCVFFGDGAVWVCWATALLLALWLACSIKPSAQAYAQVVARQMDALEPASAGPPRHHAQVGASTAQSRPVELQVVAAADLPPAGGEAQALLGRSAVRRAALAQLDVWAVLSLGVLHGLCWLLAKGLRLPGPGASAEADVPFFELFVGAFFVMLVFGFLDWRDFTRAGQARPAASDEDWTGSAGTVLKLWQLALLVRLPFLFGLTEAADHSLHLQFTRSTAWAAAAAGLALVLHGLAHRWMRWRVLQGHPVPPPRRLVMLRVFGSDALADLQHLVEPWYRVGTIDYLEGYDTVGSRSDVQAAADSGRVEQVLVKTEAEVQARLNASPLEPGPDLRFRSAPFQCTGATWRSAVMGMLARADAVVMDLSSLAPNNQGCAWELQQLLNRVPLSRVTLLINDSTDLALLRQILQGAASRLAPDSPNAAVDVPIDTGPEALVWRLLSIGGRSVRRDDESHHDWLRRTDQRLDAERLFARLYASASPPREGPLRPGLSAARTRDWAFSGWHWRLAVVVLVAALAAYAGRPGAA
jgi:hypothetical protein